MVESKHALYRLAKGTEYSYKILAGKEDTELSEEDLTLSWRELSVESLRQCRSVGN